MHQSRLQAQGFWYQRRSCRRFRQIIRTVCQRFVGRIVDLCEKRPQQPSVQVCAGRETSARDNSVWQSGDATRSRGLVAIVATLGNVCTHEMSILPRPPECSRKDSPHPWTYDSSTLLGSNARTLSQASNIFNFLDSLTREEANE